MPLQDFVWWHKLVHLSTGHCYQIVPVHVNCWKELNGKERRTWKKDFYERLLVVLSVVKINTLYIGSKMRRVKK